MNKETVKLNYLHMTPRKVRLIANLIKGLSANEAEAQLLVNPRRASNPLLKLLRSAVANAVNNKKMNKDRLIVDSVRVDQGPSLKRFLPRAMGRATPILKRMSHVTLVLAETEKKSIESRFNIISKKPKKPSKESKGKGKLKPKAQTEKEVTSHRKEKVGFFRKIFNRKSV